VVWKLRTKKRGEWREKERKMVWKLRTKKKSGEREREEVEYTLDIHTQRDGMDVE